MEWQGKYPDAATEKTLRQVLLRLRKSTTVAAKQDHDKPMATSAAAELVKMKVPKSIQMKAFAIAGSPKGTPDAIVYDKQL